MGDLVVCEKVNELRALLSQLKADGNMISFVPTMGALHHGHISLVEQAAEIGDFVVVSIFVNPKQFGKKPFPKFPKFLLKIYQLLKMLVKIKIY